MIENLNNKEILENAAFFSVSSFLSNPHPTYFHPVIDVNLRALRRALQGGFRELVCFMALLSPQEVTLGILVFPVPSAWPAQRC